MLTLIELQKLQDKSSYIIKENERLTNENKKLKDTYDMLEKHIKLYSDQLKSIKEELSSIEIFRIEKSKLVSDILALQKEKFNLVSEIENENEILKSLKTYKDQFV